MNNDDKQNSDLKTSTSMLHVNQTVNNKAKGKKLTSQELNISILHCTGGPRYPRSFYLRIRLFTNVKLALKV